MIITMIITIIDYYMQLWMGTEYLYKASWTGEENKYICTFHTSICKEIGGFIYLTCG